MTCVPSPEPRGIPQAPAGGASPAITDPGSQGFDSARRYRVLATLGRGGMGIVYKVHDQELDEVIALKVLDARNDRPLARERFKQELKLARRINHPNVARVFDLIVWNDRLAISQEFVDGGDLARWSGGPFGTDAIHGLLRSLCSALDAAHNLGVIHRDLKPSNVLIDRLGRPYIVDFGTAVLAGASSQDPRFFYGTPAYMAPEQILRPAEADVRSDLYSLGVMIFQLTTGQLPFPALSKADALSAHLKTAPPRPRSIHPGVSLGVEAVILRCLSKEPIERYQSARELIQDLGTRLNREHKGVAPPVVVQPSAKGKVLLVEDDQELRAWMSTILRARGCVVVEAEDGYRGVELALQEKPDLVLLDILMPRLDGREVLRILKSNKRLASIPVVMVTSLSDDEEALFSRESGAASFLNKPVQRDVLELLVERYIVPEARG